MTEEEIQKVRELVHEILKTFPLRTFHADSLQHARVHLVEALFWIESTKI